MSKISQYGTVTLPPTTLRLIGTDTANTTEAASGTTEAVTVAVLLPGVVWPSGDPSGVTDHSAVVAALSAVNSATLMPGVYYGNATVIIGLGQSVRGLGGKAATLWHNVGSTAAFKIENTGAYNGDTPAELTGLHIDGASASSGAMGLQFGDIMHIEIDVWISNFTSGNYGSHAINTTWWTEQAKVKLFVQNCDNGVKLDLSGSGTQSYDRCELDIQFDQGANQNGLIIGGSPGAVLLGGVVRLHGNWGVSSTAVTSSVISFLNQFGNILSTRIEIDLECDGTGTHTPQTIVFYDSTTVISNCGGNIDFAGGSHAFAASNNNGNFWFDGPVTGDSSLIQKIGPAPWAYYANTGFPTGISGEIIFQLARGDGMVFAQFQLTVNSGTTLTNGETLYTGLPSWAYGPNNRFILISVNGVIQPFEITTSGTVTYNGPTQTLGSTVFPFGQQTYSNSL